MRLAPFFLFVILALPAAAQEEEIGEGLPAPSFSLRTLNPDACGAAWIALDRFVGEEAEDAATRAVLISFFASWCEPCKREMPFLVQLDRMYRERGLRVLSVDIDREDPGIAAAKRMAAAAKATHPVLSDRFNFLARRYLGEQAPLPSVFVVRRDGTVAKIERGYAKDASAFLLEHVQLALGMEPVRARPPARATAAAALLVVAAPALADEEIAEGLPAPAFSLRTMNPDACGASWIALDRFVGEEAEDAASKAVVISFFASWCEPCKREMPFLVQLDRMYREQGLRVLGICIDKEEPGIEAAKKLIAERGVGYPVLSDRFNFLARRYLGEKAPLPSVFLIKRDGTIAKIERGYAKDASAFLLGEVQDVLGIQRQPVKAAGRTPEPAAKKSAAVGK